MVRKVILTAFSIDLILAGILFLLSPNPLPALKGILFGGSIAILMFYALFLSVSRMVEKTPEKGKRHTMISYGMRMVLYAMVLVVAAKAKDISFTTTVLGLLSIKFAIYFGNLWYLYGERR